MPLIYQYRTDWQLIIAIKVVHKELFQKVLLNCRKAIVNIDRVSGIFLTYQTLGTRR